MNNRATVNKSLLRYMMAWDIATGLNSPLVFIYLLFCSGFFVRRYRGKTEDQAAEKWRGNELLESFFSIVFYAKNT